MKLQCLILHYAEHVVTVLEPALWALFRYHDSRVVDRWCILCLFMSMCVQGAARGLNFAVTQLIVITRLSALSVVNSHQRECYLFLAPVLGARVVLPVPLLVLPEVYNSEAVCLIVECSRPRPLRIRPPLPRTFKGPSYKLACLSCLSLTILDLA